MKKSFVVISIALFFCLSSVVAFSFPSDAPSGTTFYVSYVYSDGSVAAPSMWGIPHVGREVLVPVPKRSGYVPTLSYCSIGSVSDYPLNVFSDGSASISFNMPSGTLELIVTYAEGSLPPPSSSEPPPSSSELPPSSSELPPSSGGGILINPDYVGFNLQSIDEMAVTLRYNIGSGFTAFLLVFLFVSTIYLLIHVSRYLLS